LISPDRLDTELSRSRDNWTGNGIQTKDIIDFIRYSLDVNPNTVIEEVTFYCGLDYSA